MPNPTYKTYAQAYPDIADNPYARPPCSSPWLDTLVFATPVPETTRKRIKADWEPSLEKLKYFPRNYHEGPN